MSVDRINGNSNIWKNKVSDTGVKRNKDTDTQVTFSERLSNARTDTIEISKQDNSQVQENYNISDAQGGLGCIGTTSTQKFLEIKAKVQSGTYEIDAEELANKIKPYLNDINIDSM